MPLLARCLRFSPHPGEELLLAATFFGDDDAFFGDDAAFFGDDAAFFGDDAAFFGDAFGEANGNGAFFGEDAALFFGDAALFFGVADASFGDAALGDATRSGEASAPTFCFSLAVSKDRGQSVEEPLARPPFREKSQPVPLCLKIPPPDRSHCISPAQGSSSRHHTLLPQSSHPPSPRPLVQTLLDGVSVLLPGLPSLVVNPPLESTASWGEQWHAPHAPARPPVERPLSVSPLPHHWTSRHFQ